MKNIALLSVLGCLPLLACGGASSTTVDGGTGSGGANGGGSGGAQGGSGGGAGGGSCSVGSAALTGPTADATCSGLFTMGSYTGYFFTMSDKGDGGGSTICPQCTDTSCNPKVTTSMCASGTAGKVQGTAYSAYWGAGVGWNLNEQASAPTCKAAAGAGTVDLTGKSISYAVDSAPSAFRIKLDTGKTTENLCLDISSKASGTVAVKDFVDQCWSSGTKAPITADQQKAVKALQFQVFTNQNTDVNFDFCITNLSIQ